MLKNISLYSFYKYFGEKITVDNIIRYLYLFQNLCSNNTNFKLPHRLESCYTCQNTLRHDIGVGDTT